MFNDTTIRYSEELRRELLQDAERIRQVRIGKQKRVRSKDMAEPRAIEFSDYIKTGLAAIFHR
jgi:hypothetical protein